MQATILTKKRFDNLKPYELPNNVFNTEARLYVLKTKEKWKNVNKLLKKFYVRNGAIFSNKLYTINSLIDNKEKRYLSNFLNLEIIKKARNEGIVYKEYEFFDLENNIIDMFNKVRV